jgi:hypothetical protein
MEKQNPFVGLKNKLKEVNIDGIIIWVKPSVKDAEMFMLMKKEMNESEAEKVSQIMRNIILRANPEANPEDVDAFIAEHYGALIKAIAITFGFATDVDFEAIKKKIQQKE